MPEATTAADPSQQTAANVVTDQPTTEVPGAVAPEQQVTPSAPEVTTPGTALETPATPAAPGPAYWPDEWREKLAGKDEKMLARLYRYTELPHVFQAWREAEKTITAGDHKRWAPPENADETAIANFRKDRGIPGEADAYLTDLPNGYVIGESDKPTLQKFAEIFHNRHVPADLGRDLVTQYFEAQQAAQDARWKQDEIDRRAGVDELRAEMGPDYPGNVNAIMNLLSGAPEEIKLALQEARGPDGSKLFNSPGVLRMFARWAKEANPASTIVPGNAISAGETIDGELASITSKMGDMHSEYWRGPKSARSPQETELQVRYRDLIDAKQRLKR